MNTKAVGQTIRKVATSIAGEHGTKWANTVAPNNLADEIADTMKKDFVSGGIFNENTKRPINDAVDRILNASNQTENEALKQQAEELINNINKDNLDETLEKLQQILAGDGSLQKRINAEFARAKKTTMERMQQSAGDITTADMKAQYTKPEYYAKAAKAYFKGPTKEVGKTRKISAVAGYMGVASGARILSGGNPVQDEYGQTDIAGIPFI